MLFIPFKGISMRQNWVFFQNMIAFWILMLVINFIFTVGLGIKLRSNYQNT
jgi:hypothetical protein